MPMMKAVRIHSYGGPEALVYEEAPKPEAAAGEVLIRVHAAGVNPLDWKVREGYLKDIHKLPLIPGWDVSGVVETIGTDVTDFKPGAEVYGLLDITHNGAYAEYVAAKALYMAFKPKEIDHVHTAAVPVAALAAWESLFDLADLSKGQTVLIHGATGGVGHFAVQMAKWKGALVIGTTSGDNVDFASEIGVDEAIDYQTTRFEDVVCNIDVVLDLIGGDTQKRSWQVLKKGGVLVSSVGISSPEVATEHGVQAKELLAHPDAKELTRIATLIDAGVLKPIVNTVLPLSETRKAHELIQTGQVRGKIVLKIKD